MSSGRASFKPVPQAPQLIPDGMLEVSGGRASFKLVPQAPMRSSIAPVTPTTVQGRRSTVPDLSPESLQELFQALDAKEMDERAFLDALYQASGSPPGSTLPLNLTTNGPAQATPADIRSPSTKITSTGCGSEAQQGVGETTDAASVDPAERSPGLQDDAASIMK
jgi:hypothetical protein